MAPTSGRAAWEQAGEALLAEYRAINGGKLADYAVSHAGETAFPRSFQLLGPGGVLAFYGASSGYHLSFMGKKWDYDVPSVEVWAECLRVLKPGGHLLSFAGTRTQHRLAVRIEDAGFEVAAIEA